MNKINPRIVCAANRNELGDIVLGVRHYDCLMRCAIEDYKEASGIGEDYYKFDEQGFIDQYGNFYTRTEAWKIAEENGQIIRRCGGDDVNGGTLYSENLY